MLTINPSSDRLGKENAVLSGRGTRYYVPDFEGSLSIKSVTTGTAVWETENRRFLVSEDSWLILNDRQRYTITIDSIRPVATFCLFFERGFVEGVSRALLTRSANLLDSPPSQRNSLHFLNRIEPAGDGPLLNAVRRFQTELSRERMSRVEWDEQFERIAEVLILSQHGNLRAIESLPALRETTRSEIYRRVLKGRDFLLCSLSEPIQLKEMAGAACLSPFHFHRTFKRAFGETPHGYLTRQRLHRAARLLSETELSVTEVCLSCGFESVTSFSDLFRRRFNVSPGKFSKIREADQPIHL